MFFGKGEIMRASDIKKIITENDMFNLLKELNGEPIIQGNSIMCKTICHNGHKHKMFYYEDKQIFRCFTDSCGSFDIFGLVEKVLGMNFIQSLKYICDKLGIIYSVGDDIPKLGGVDFSFVSKFKDKETEKVSISVLDPSVLNIYDNLYHSLWVRDGISTESMKKFNIRFSVLNNQIVIPHYNEQSDLVGVRVRNLDEDAVQAGFKYMPINHKGNVLKHPTGALLYGLDKNLRNIKRIKKIILVESEKSVLQLDSMLPEFSIAVCLSGSSLTQYQAEIIKSLGIDEVIVALDKEYDTIGSIEERFYAEKIKSVFADKLSLYVNVSVMWDLEGILKRQESPTDRGKDIFLHLFENRIFI